MINKLIKLASLLILIGSVAQASAHTYFVGLTDLQLNPQNNHLEIVHLYTTHDLEHVLMEFHQKKLSADHPQFEQYLTAFLNDNFALSVDGKKVDIGWVGFELDYDKIVVYQEVVTELRGTTLAIQHTVLSKVFEQQVNTLNYALASQKGTLIFDQLKQSAKISIK